MKLIQLISLFSPLLPISVFLLFFRFNKQEKLKWVIFILLIVSLSFDFFSYNLAKKSIHTIALINTYLLIEACFLFFFFLFLFVKNKVAKTISKVGFTLVIIVWIYLNIFKNGYSLAYDYVSISLEFIIIFILCLLYFFYTISQIRNTIPAYNTASFWLIAALLLYCASTFFSFFIPTNLSNQTNDTIAFEYISRVANILKNILFSIAFIINTNKNNTTNKHKSIYNVSEY